MKVLLLIGGPHRVGMADGEFPASLIELNGKPVIELIVDKIKEIRKSIELIVCIKSELIRKFHYDQVISILWPEATIIPIEHETKGAVCTALLAVEQIDVDEPLLILGSDELIDCSFSEVISRFDNSMLDAGVVIFPSIHPRYSFVQLDDYGLVSEAAEKRPISRNATATFYYYRSGQEFVEAAKNTIRKGASVNGSYYLCPVLNELVLDNARIGVYEIPTKKYHPLKSSKQISEVERIYEEMNHYEISKS
jgi:dTDP-glucose pyrophosphorylase